MRTYPFLQRTVSLLSRVYNDWPKEVSTDFTVLRDVLTSCKVQSKLSVKLIVTNNIDSFTIVYPVITFFKCYVVENTVIPHYDGNIGIKLYTHQITVF